MTSVVGAVRDNGEVQGYRDDGVVLRTQKLGEADRIITLLTRHHGRVRAVAKGVRRTKSRFGARLEPFTHVDVMVHAGRSLDTITQAEVIRAYGTPLAANYPKYTAGTAMLETAERFTPVEKEPAIRQFLLLIGGSAGARGRHRARGPGRKRRPGRVDGAQATLPAGRAADPGRAESATPPGRAACPGRRVSAPAAPRRRVRASRGRAGVPPRQAWANPSRRAIPGWSSTPISCGR